MLLDVDLDLCLSDFFPFVGGDGGGVCCCHCFVGFVECFCLLCFYLYCCSVYFEC